MNRIWALVALALIVAATPGCSQKDPAAEAIAAAEQSLADVHESAMKYLPDQYDGIKADLEKARKAFEEQKYADALAAVKTIPARAQQLGEDAAAAKEVATAQLTETWNALSGSIPERLAQLEARLAELGKLRQLPAGIEQNSINIAESSVEWARKEWDEASAAFAAGKLEEAAKLAKAVDTLLVTGMTVVGLTPPAPETPQQ
jgi:hypothetical protein